MAGDRWLFTKEQLLDTPSRKYGISEEKELAYRQQAAHFIQNAGQKLTVNQLCINTAIVYMHRFYMFQSFTRFNRYSMSAACLFLAAKVEEQPRKLEHVIKVTHHLTNRTEDGNAPPPLDVKSNQYLEKVQEMVINENLLLQTLGFNVTIDHSNTHVVKTCQLVNAPKELSQTSYFLSTNSLHLTTMCLQYQPKIIAAVCIHLACKWSNWELPKSNEGKDWFEYVDSTLTLEQLEGITKEFLSVVEKLDPKYKKQLMANLKVNADSSPNSRPCSPAPSTSIVPTGAPAYRNTTPTYVSSAAASQALASPQAGSVKAKPAGTDSTAKTYAEHRKQHAGAPASSSNTSRPEDARNTSLSAKHSRPLHGESPLVRNELKRPHPADPHSQTSTQPNSKSVSGSGNSSVNNPYNQTRSNEKKNSHHHHQNSNAHIEASPLKKMKYGENGNGASNLHKPPLPPELPQPKPPPPP